MMDNRLYVTNLSAAASLSSLRSCFGACGEVTEVEFAAERHAHRMASSAFVTMATVQGARQAVQELHGKLLDGRTLMVTVVSGRDSADARAEAREAKAAEARVTTTITQQYRERHNMTYELDCQGSRLTLRVFFPPEVGPATDWRIEARSGGEGAATIEKVAPTREQALQQISEAWQASATDLLLPTFDWAAVTRAMQGVRAI